jgi:hypothetical protein
MLIGERLPGDDGKFSGDGKHVIVERLLLQRLPIRLTHTPTRDRFCVYNG